MASLIDVIVKPLLTEKASMLAETANKYAFEVKPNASKTQIKTAIEKLYDVRVLKVWTNRTPGKLKRFGRYVAKAGMTKKAYIQIDSGQKIEFFKGV
jgi:large subunit ribosomal protein L23